MIRILHALLFKKDQMNTKDKEKIKFNENCLKMDKKETIEKSEEPYGEKLYILQDTNKLQKGKFGVLPKYMDFF